MPIINKFNGGIITGYNDMYVSPEHSIALVDVDISRIGLLSAKTPLKLRDNVKSYFHEFPISEEIVRYAGTPDEEIELQFVEPYTTFVTSSDSETHYTEFNGRLCYSNGGPLCKTTDGIFDGTDFVWQNIGASVPVGNIVARVITVIEDIPTAVVTLNTGANGTIDISTIRYRVVYDGTVYIHEITNNTGKATVSWTLPAGYKVYRELIDEYGDNTDVFVFVGTGTFVDGLVAMAEGYEFANTLTVEDKSSYRLSLVEGKVYSVPFSTITTSDHITINVPNVNYLDANNVWQSTYIGLTVTNSNITLGAIASGFAYAGGLYIMIRCGDITQVYSNTGLVYEGTHMDDEFFKGSTVEHVTVPEGVHTLYIFNPRIGKVALFDGVRFTIKDTQVFPEATAQNSVYTIYNNTVYALINDSVEANVRSIHLPSLEIGYTGYERIKLDKIKGLGGTSGCNMTAGDFQIFPIMKGVVSFSRVSNQVARQDNATATTDASIRGYVFRDGVINLVADTSLISWKYIGSPLDYDILDEPTLTGTYVYNVCELSDMGLDGPIMLVENNPVSVYKGHIKVDLTSITHTNELRLFRTGGYLTAFKMVLDANPLPLNAYIDKISDVSLALAREGLYSHVYAPPKNLKWLTSHRGMLFGVVGNKLFWSQAGTADYWDASVNILLLDTPIYGLISGANGLIIFMQHSISLLLGYSPEEFELRTVIKDRGTNSSNSIQPTKGGALFFATDGLCFTDGLQIEDISFTPLGNIRNKVISSCVTDRYYYALIDNFTASKYNRIILTFAIHTEVAFSSLDGDQVTSMGIVGGKVAHTYNEMLYNTLEGNRLRKFYYKSGNITNGQLTVVKEWDRIRITGDYIGTFMVYLDDLLVLSETIDATKDRVNMHLPKHSNKSKAIRFEAYGTGNIIGIEYSITDRGTTK